MRMLGTCSICRGCVSDAHPKDLGRHGLYLVPLWLLVLYQLGLAPVRHAPGHYADAPMTTTDLQPLLPHPATTAHPPR